MVCRTGNGRGGRVPSGLFTRQFHGNKMPERDDIMKVEREQVLGSVAGE